MEKKILNEHEAASYIGMSVSYLRHDRCYGALKGRKVGPVFIKLGRSVKYMMSDLDNWVVQNKIQRTVNA